jgi:hypothetical protein
LVKPGQDLKDAAARPLSFLQTVKAIGWAFFGVRRGADYDNDVAKLNPVHVIIAGLIGALVFVLLLLLLVNWVIKSNVAGAA